MGMQASQSKKRRITKRIIGFSDQFNAKSEFLGFFQGFFPWHSQPFYFFEVFPSYSGYYQKLLQINKLLLMLIGTYLMNTPMRVFVEFLMFTCHFLSM